MARTKAKAKAAATSKTWLLAPGGKVHRSDDPAAPKDWTWWCDEGDERWTPRADEPNEVTDGKP